MNIAVYPGSFAPFTNGHLHVVREASKIFDNVFIAISTNTSKAEYKGMDRMKSTIESCLKREGLNNVIVGYSSKTTGNYCNSVGAKFIVRGIRNVEDFFYEETIAKTNKLLYPDIETIYIRAKDEVVSSSMVRELLHFEMDVSKYVPPEVLELLREVVE